jgi:protein involved in polysaccharide export with SLBB domain
MQPGLRHEWVSGMNAVAGRMRRGLVLTALVTALVGCAPSAVYTPVETHSRPGRLSAAAKTLAVAIADLDNDGNLDVVAGAGEPGTITIIYGDGAGGLVETQTLAVEGDVRSVALADVNEDGLTDIIYSVQRQSSGIRIMLNQGGRRWKPGKGPIEINSYEGLRAADVNGDGHIDIVAANASSELQGGIQVWLGTGQGSWVAGAAPTVTGIYMDAAVADFNGDGRLDIAGAGWGVHGALRVWLGNPAGGWTALAPVSRGNFYGLHVADINGDGRLDLTAGTYKTGVRLFVGDGQGGFTEEFISKNDSAGGAPADAGARQALVAPHVEASFWQALPVDVNGDGRPDIVAGSLDDKGVQVWLNQAGKGWKPITDMFPRTGTFYGLAAADLNRDGRPDICAANFGEGVTLWAGRAAGAGTAAVGIAAAVVAEPRPGDAVLRENDVFKVVNGMAQYKIGAGDILEIALWDGSTAVRQEILVRPDGRISFGLAENLPVNGLTESELHALLTARLEQYLKKPRLDVLVKQHKSKSVKLLGAFGRMGVSGSGAGEYNLHGKTTLLGIITTAGGPSENADLKSVRIRRKDGETVSLNLYKTIIQGDLTQDLVLNDGDLVYLPTLSKDTNRVYVFGEVQKPGAYTFSGSEMRLIDAIADAGGTTPFAYRADTRVVRGDITQPEILSANLARLVESGDRSQNLLLASGDLVYVPRSGFGDIKLFYDQVRPLLELVLWPARVVIDWNSAADITGVK